MNYIKQRRAFDAFKREHLKQISLRDVAAYDAIFDAINERQWPQGAVSISRYELLMRFPGSWETLRRAIEELHTLGLIRVIEETSLSDAAYELVQLYEDAPMQAEEVEADSSAEKVKEGQRNFPEKTGEICAETAPDLRGNCGETAPDEPMGENVLSLDRARAHTRENKTQNVTPNEYKNQKQTQAEEEATRARRGDPPAGGEGSGHRREQGPARAAAAPGRREAVQNQGDGRGEIQPGSAQPARGENRAFETARACGFSMSKRNKAQIAAMITTYGDEWTCDALDRAAMRGKCYLGYVAAILSSWAAKGGMDEAGGRAGNVNKNAEIGVYQGAYANKQKDYSSRNLTRDYNQRTYTKEEDEALYWDPFADENTP